MGKKLLSLLFAVVLLCTVLPMTALAAPGDRPSVTITANNSTVNANTTVTFTITPSNVGQRSGTVTAKTDSGNTVKLRQGSSGSSSDSVQVGNRQTTVTATITEDTTVTVNYGNINGTNVSADVKVTVRKPSVTITADQNTVNPDTSVTFTITPSNVGSANGNVTARTDSGAVVKLKRQGSSNSSNSVQVGNQQIRVTATITENTTVTVDYGTVNGTKVSAEVKVTVNKPSVKINATKTEVEANEQVKFTIVPTNVGNRTGTVTTSPQVTLKRSNGNSFNGSVGNTSIELMGQFTKDTTVTVSYQINGNTVSDSVTFTIAACKHTKLTPVPYQMYGCEKTPSGTYYRCECGACFEENSPNSTQHEEAYFKTPIAAHHISDKVDGTATCKTDGTRDHRECLVEGCEYWFELDDSTPKTEADFQVKKETVEHKLGEVIEGDKPDCEHTGTKDYRKCSVCDKCFDLEGKELVNQEDYILPAEHRRVDPKPPVEATCTQEGRYAGWYCDACYKWSTDEVNWYEEGTQGYKDNIAIKKLEHVPKKVQGQPQTCSIDGEAEHYQCEKCDMLSLDGKEWHDIKSDNQWYLDNIVIRLDGKSHVKGTYSRPIPATCTNSGYVEFWYCRDCQTPIGDDCKPLETIYADIDYANHPEGACILYPPKDATCSGENSGGYDSHWYCSVCKKYFFADDTEFKHPMDDPSEIWHSSDGTNHVEGMCKPYGPKEATCTEDGYDAHWYCEACKKWYAADDDTFEHPMDDNSTLWHPRLGHNWVKGETDVGFEYEECSRCHKLRIDGKEVEAIPGLHSLTFEQEIPATCTENGRKAYWYCTDEDCGMKFADLEARKPVTDEELVIPAGHSIVKLDINFDNGYPYYYCTKCGSYFEDQYGKTPAKAPEGQKHVLLCHEAVAPSCQHGDGNSAYWECLDCGEFYSDEQGNNLIAPNTWIVPYRSNNMEYHDVEKKPESAQYIARNECKFCHMCFDDNGKVLDSANIGNTTNVGAHSLKYHPAVAATCTTPGTVEYYECIAGHGCGKYFADINAAKPLTKDQLVTTTAHSWLHFNEIPATMVNPGQQGYSYCTKCHMYKLDGSEKLYTAEELRQNWGIEKLPDTEVFAKPGRAATCTEPGEKAHWIVENKITGEKTYYLSELLKTPVSAADLVIPMVDHQLFFVAESATTRAHYECINCHHWFETNENTNPDAPSGDKDDFVKPEPPKTPEGVIKDNLDLSGMGLSTNGNKYNAP